MKSFILPLLFGVVLIVAVSAQDEADSGDPEGTPPPEDPLKVQRDILSFGITSEVVELLESLRTNRDSRLASDVAELLEGDVPVDIQVAAFEYFNTIESPEATDRASEVLLVSEELPDRLVLTALRYLRNPASEYSPPEEAVEALGTLSLSSDLEIARQALRLMGQSDVEESLRFLIEVAGSLEEAQPRREAAILALGDVAKGEAREVLTTILTDRAEEDSLRWYAADSLGKIGDPASVPVLQDQLSDANTWFRAYLIGALGRYEGRVDDDVFVAALRDDFWRVRVSALETLGARRSRNALDAIAYRARRDPVDDVRTAAFEALGTMQINEARRFLSEYAAGSGNPAKHRGTAARVLVESYLLGGRDDIEDLLEQEWSTERSAVLSSLVMALSTSEDPLAGPLLVKLLEHPDPGTQVRALMGMRRVGAASYRSEIERAAEESPHGAVRRQAEMALEEM